MNANKQVTALGEFYYATQKLDGVRGGNQKLQRIIGKELFWKGYKGWFFNNAIIKEMSVSELTALTDKINKSIK